MLRSMKASCGIGLVAMLCTACLDFDQFQLGTGGGGGEGGAGASGGGGAATTTSSTGGAGGGGGDDDGQGGADPAPTFPCGPEAGTIVQGSKEEQWSLRGTAIYSSGTIGSAFQGGLFTNLSYPIGNCYVVFELTQRPSSGKVFVTLTTKDGQNELGLAGDSELSLVVDAAEGLATLAGNQKTLDVAPGEFDALRILFTTHYVTYEVLSGDAIVASRRRTRPKDGSTQKPHFIGVGIDAAGMGDQAVGLGPYGQRAPVGP
jgi:hypothetical protein